jgi:hypothetical protein
MDRIIIDISKGELDFMREALQTKHINLMSYLDTCEADVIRKEVLSSKPTWDDASKITEDEFEKELQEIMHDKAVAKNKKTFVYRPKKAPYGVKKDGTPKAKPGRKA